METDQTTEAQLAAWHEAGHVVAFHLAGIRVLGATSGVPEGAPVGVRGCTWTEDFGGFSKFVQPSGEGHLIDHAGFREWMNGQDSGLVHARIRAAIFGLLGGGVAVAQMRTVEGVPGDMNGDGMDTLATVAFESMLPAQFQRCGRPVPLAESSWLAPGTEEVFRSRIPSDTLSRG